MFSTSFNENSLEKLSNVLLNYTNELDENIFNNLSQIDSIFDAVEEVATSLKKFSDKTFSVSHLNMCNSYVERIAKIIKCF